MTAATTGYVYACYAITVGALGTYAAWVISKYRAANKRTREDS